MKLNQKAYLSVMHDINYTNLRKNLVVDRINGLNSSFPLPHSWGIFPLLL